MKPCPSTHVIFPECLLCAGQGLWREAKIDAVPVSRGPGSHQGVWPVNKYVVSGTERGRHSAPFEGLEEGFLGRRWDCKPTRSWPDGPRLAPACLW